MRNLEEIAGDVAHVIVNGNNSEDLIRDLLIEFGKEIKRQSCLEALTPVTNAFRVLVGKVEDQ